MKKNILICLTLVSMQVFSFVDFDVELVCRQTLFKIDRGLFLAGFDKHQKNEIQRKDNIDQIYSRYCFLNEEEMTFKCDDYIRLDRDLIFTKSGFQLDRKTLEGSLYGIGKGLKCYSDKVWFKKELDLRIEKHRSILKENVL
jgi:hypothetical protein